MAFFTPRSILVIATLALSSSLAAAPAQAGLLSSSGNTYLVQDGQQFYYSSDIGNQRFTGTIRGNYNSVGYFNGRFTDYSTSGEGCTGSFNQGKLQRDGTIDLSFNVDGAAPNHRCKTIGQTFSLTVEPMGRNAYSAMLWSDSPNQRIKIYGSAGAGVALESYGIRGDRVTLIERIPTLNRLRVTFGSGVTGWVDTSNVIYD